MRTIYLVISCIGEYDNYREYIERAFNSREKAEGFLKEREASENNERAMADKCRECAGLNKECPFYIDSIDISDECENYKPYHDNVTYKIIETYLME